MSKTLRERVMDEADLCRNDGADDIARLLDEVAAALADDQQALGTARAMVASLTAERVARADQAQAEPVAWKPTEQQILEAAEKAGLWPNTVHRWLQAFDRFFDCLELTAPQPAAQPVACAASHLCDCQEAGRPCARKTAAQPVAVPDGYALVPVEPTPEMLDAAFAFESQGSGIQGGDLEDVYGAMLSAAPKVQQ